MANTLITPSIVAQESLMILSNNLVAAQLVHRDHTTEFTAAKIGDTVTIRGPFQPTVDEFTTAINLQDITESSVDLVLEKHFDVSVAVSSKEWTLELDQFSERVIAPSVVAIAEKIDAYLYSKYFEIPYSSGTVGDPPDSVGDLAQVRKVLSENKVPLGERVGLLNPAAEADFLTIEAVHSAEKRGDAGTTLRDASMGRIMGIDWFAAQGVKSHTSGTASGIATPLINGAFSAGVSVIDIDGGAGTETLLVGDIINISGEGAHYVTANNTATGGAFTGVAIKPALRANVANNTAVTIPASHAANLVMHRNAMTLAVVPLDLPQGNTTASYNNFNGLGIRVVFDYDSSTKKDTISFDVLCGAKVQHPELALRLFG